LAQAVTARLAERLSAMFEWSCMRSSKRIGPCAGLSGQLWSFTAGFIDSFTVLALLGFFVAQVTGSFVLMAAATVRHEQGGLTKVLAVPIFLIAGMMTTVIAVALKRRGRARKVRLSLCCQLS
jgi:uncharacterized membrane protein YoaK (UPF0700 family)